MKRSHHTVRLAAAAVLVVAVVAALGATRAAANTPTPVTIHEVTVFGTNHQPPSGVFTATGLDGCVSGTFSDSLIAFSPSGARVKVDRSYVCSGGATFTARVAIHLGVVASDGTQTVESTWNIVSSSAGIDGSGSGSGVNAGCSPVGTAFAECLASDGSITAHVH